MRHAALVAACGLALATGLTAVAATAPAIPAADTRAFIDGWGDLLTRETEGRGVGTPGPDKAAALIASGMRGLGLAPAGDTPVLPGDEAFFQTLRVTTGVRVGEPCAIAAGGIEAAPGADFQPIGFSTNGTLEAPVVFAGYGITAEGFDYDDYAGLDVSGKIVLVLASEPQEMDTTSRFNGDIQTAHAELRTKAIVARERGALGMLVVNGPLHHRGEPIPAPRTGSAGYMTSGLLAAQVSERVANALLAADGATLETLQRAIDAHGRPHSIALATPVKLTITLERTRADIHNVVGRVRGRDTTRAIVIGAHYDHLGYGGESSLAPDSAVVHPGADDNVSGVAALLQAARTFAARAAAGRPPAHTLIFAAFTGEESGLLGSAHFVDQPPVPLESIEAMINMDMVGRLREDRLMIMGAGTAAEFRTVLGNVNADLDSAFTLRLTDDGFGPSDHSSFYKRDVPVLAMFTGVHEDYHRPSDTWDRINVRGIEQVADFVGAIVDSLGARPRVKYVQAEAAPMAAIGGGSGFGAYLGTIPDYVQTDGGVLLSGVRKGAPADEAGLRGGDTIVKFDGVGIDNIYDYTYALRSRKPGQRVRITVVRGADTLDIDVTLGRRGEPMRGAPPGAPPAPAHPGSGENPHSGHGG